jgi:uncharacterized protein
MKPNMHGKTALVTGASSGIGEATARRLSQEGLRTILVARRAERLWRVVEQIQASGGQALALVADLSQESERIRVYEEVMLYTGGLDVLVNNAGFGWYGYLEDMPWTIAKDMLSVNVEAVVHLTRLFLPGMKARGSGHIINMGSIVSSLPSQGTAAYAGTKAFLGAFSTALHRELYGSGVQVSVVLPGPVATELFDNSACLEKGRRIPMEAAAIPPEKVAAAVWLLLRHPRRFVYVPGFLMLVPLVEFCFGWCMDRIGPILLKQP